MKTLNSIPPEGGIESRQELKVAVVEQLGYRSKLFCLATAKPLRVKLPAGRKFVIVRMPGRSIKVGNMVLKKARTFTTTSCVEGRVGNTDFSLFVLPVGTLIRLLPLAGNK